MSIERQQIQRDIAEISEEQYQKSLPCNCIACTFDPKLDTTDIKLAIRSHAIAYKTCLSRIVVDGEVLTAATRDLRNPKAQEIRELRKIRPKKEASVFRGYCSAHDASLFINADGLPNRIQKSN